VELKKREPASVSNKQKAPKSLNSQWFQKKEKETKTAQQGDTTTKYPSYLEHDRLVELET
jgi:hypothetical protein